MQWHETYSGPGVPVKPSRQVGLKVTFEQTARTDWIVCNCKDPMEPGGCEEKSNIMEPLPDMSIIPIVI